MIDDCKASDFGYTDADCSLCSYLIHVHANQIFVSSQYTNFQKQTQIPIQTNIGVLQPGLQLAHTVQSTIIYADRFYVYIRMSK